MTDANKEFNDAISEVSLQKREDEIAARSEIVARGDVITIYDPESLRDGVYQRMKSYKKGENGELIAISKDEANKLATEQRNKGIDITPKKLSNKYYGNNLMAIKEENGNVIRMDVKQGKTLSQENFQSKINDTAAQKRADEVAARSEIVARGDVITVYDPESKRNGIYQTMQSYQKNENGELVPISSDEANKLVTEQKNKGKDVTPKKLSNKYYGNGLMAMKEENGNVIRMDVKQGKTFSANENNNSKSDKEQTATVETQSIKQEEFNSAIGDVSMQKRDDEVAARSEIVARGDIVTIYDPESKRDGVYQKMQSYKKNENGELVAISNDEANKLVTEQRNNGKDVTPKKLPNKYYGNNLMAIKEENGNVIRMDVKQGKTLSQENFQSKINDTAAQKRADEAAARSEVVMRGNIMTVYDPESKRDGVYQSMQSYQKNDKGELVPISNDDANKLVTEQRNKGLDVTPKKLASKYYGNGLMAMKEENGNVIRMDVKAANSNTASVPTNKNIMAAAMSKNMAHSY